LDTVENDGKVSDNVAKDGERTQTRTPPRRGRVARWAGESWPVFFLGFRSG